MVARGDRGVEIGVERLAELQEEILWLTEAAQTPVIWAAVASLGDRPLHREDRQHLQTLRLRQARDQ